MLSESSCIPGLETMITVRPGSHVHRLITVLGLAGEYPVRSLGVLGNERTLRALVSKLSTTQELRNPDTGERMRVKLLQLTGIGNAKAIRFCKGALPILEWIHPDAYGYYMAAFYNHRFPGGMAHRDRNLRVAETIGMHLTAGIETRVYLLPALQNRAILRITPDAPAFYLARDFKKISPAEQNKTMFTRIVGAIFYPGGCYAVYNTRSAAMKWNGMGEFKALHSLTELARMNAGVQSIDSAILLGESYDTALTTLLESDKNRRLELRFDGIYRHIYFVPMNAGGIRQFRLLTVPDWKEKLLELLFDPGVRSYNRGFMEYDASIGGTCVFSHLDGDIARLIRFREAMQTGAGSFEVLCFDDQAPLSKRVSWPVYHTQNHRRCHSRSRTGTIKEECILDKKRAAAIIAVSIPGLITLLYLGGVLGQLLINYELWMNSGGLTGQTTIGAVDWNPIVCLGSAFSIPGLKASVYCC